MFRCGEPREVRPVRTSAPIHASIHTRLLAKLRLKPPSASESTVDSQQSTVVDRFSCRLSTVDCRLLTGS